MVENFRDVFGNEVPTPIQEKGCPWCGGDVAAQPWRGWTATCLKCGRLLSLRGFRETTRRLLKVG